MSNKDFKKKKKKLKVSPQVKASLPAWQISTKKKEDNLRLWKKTPYIR